MNRTKFFAAIVCLTGLLGLLTFGHASAQSYLGSSDLGSIRQSNQTPAVSPAVAAVGKPTATVTDAHAASASINRTASERNGPSTGPSDQQVAATNNALDTRNLQHPRQTKPSASTVRGARPE
ncbi:hypothetical protein [Pandoraea sputorum]|uniref:Uncharacterized protein n=1 Tax=Pandoraea sputorum TaxID=93222 RepID=A0A239SGA4_9BURK|nr:hypothetical protein [Pandoraea sputorum]AJC16804.1 hypothetical protein NA29_13730 [Pandoraea sputorum]SNU84252.1 Uncharacterised protein [Pandoraea sputorum]VVD90549.1 hypothetical protein PSP20601_01595 [Pandoraea sputorum]VVE79383.1 hypothetical protein PSP31121_02091 [Pandoraea sputorum]BET10371.1 hypothetical protein THI4931_14130 [Pandoraea sputorum]